MQRHGVRSVPDTLNVTSPFLGLRKERKASRAGHVRVGLGNNLWLHKGVLGLSNAAQVARARQIIEGIRFEGGTPDDVRNYFSQRL